MRKELLKTRAYTIFKDELEKNISYAKDKFIHSEIISEQNCKDAKDMFHTIKGSSGFFGFNEMHANAAALEKLFKNSMEDLVCEMDTVRKLISEIEEIVGDLPDAPKPEGSENA